MIPDALLGEVIAAVVVGAALAVALCAVVLRQFRRSVHAGMHQAGAEFSDDVDSGGRGEVAMRSGGSAPEPLRPSASLRPVAVVYAAAALAFAVVVAAAYLMMTNNLNPVAMLVATLQFGWPAVLVMALVIAPRSRGFLGILLAYALVTFAIFAWVAARNSLPVVGLLRTWVLANVPFTILALLFLRRSVRAVGPLVLAIAISLTLAASLIITSLVGVGLLETVVAPLVIPMSAVGLDAVAVYIAVVIVSLVGAAIALPFVWLAMKGVGVSYQRKRFSDQSLSIDSLMLMYACSCALIDFVWDGAVWLLAPVAAFGAYKLVTALGFELLRAKKSSHAPSLLLLRVFSLGRRSERLFDEFARVWLRLGPVNLIAGPDLATSVVAPHEFVEFLGGHLSREFVHDEATCDERMRELDEAPDPDGRFRVSQFFCSGGSWKAVMRRLAARSTAVLMDLRSFSEQNRGCQYELESLLELVPLQRVVLLTDATTDRAYLESVLTGMCSGLSEKSPNWGLADSASRIVEIDGDGWRQTGQVLEATMQAAAAG